MFLALENKSRLKIFATILTILVAFIIINPYTNIDIILLATIGLIIGQALLKEKLLLLFLLIRPTLDYWRDYNLFTIFHTDVNLNAVLSILFLFWSLYWLVIYRKKILQLPFFIQAGLVIMVMLASTIYSVSPITSLVEITKFFNLIAFLFITYIFINDKKIAIKELLWTIVLSTIVPLSLACFQLILGTGINTDGVLYRIYGTFGHPNVLAFFILSLLFLHWQYSHIKPLEFWQNKVVLKNTIFGFLIILLLATATRAGMIGLLIFITITGWYYFRKNLLILLGGILAFYILFYPLNNWLIQNTDYNLQNISIINRLTTQNEDADSVDWRLSLFRESIPFIYAKPLLGYGYGTFPIVWETNRGMWHFWDDSAEAHNDYLRLAFEIGLIGFVFYLIFLTTLAWQTLNLAIKNKQQYLYFFAWVVVFLALSITDNMLHHTPVMWLTWACWGAILAGGDDTTTEQQ